MENYFEELKKSIVEGSALAAAYIRETFKNYPYMYQDCLLTWKMPEMHEGAFAAIFEEFANQDLSAVGQGKSINVFRMRYYMAATFCDLAFRGRPLEKAETGGYLTAGVSYGTCPAIIAKYLKFGDEGYPDPVIYLLDPMKGYKNSKIKTNAQNFNCDIQLVVNKFKTLVRLFISINFCRRTL